MDFDEDEKESGCADRIFWGVFNLIVFGIIYFLIYSLWGLFGDEITEYFVKDIEIWKEEYSNGSIKVEYEYYTHSENNKRIKDGWYKSYYEDAGYKEIGNYKENVRDGGWIFYSKNGKETNRTY